MKHHDGSKEAAECLWKPTEQALLSWEHMANCSDHDSEREAHRRRRDGRRYRVGTPKPTSLTEEQLIANGIVGIYCMVTGECLKCESKFRIPTFEEEMMSPSNTSCHPTSMSPMGISANGKGWVNYNHTCHCGARTPYPQYEGKHCPKCGVTQQVANIPCQVTPIQTCPSCGHSETTPDAKFCSECGNPLSSKGKRK